MRRLQEAQGQQQTRESIHLSRDARPHLANVQLTAFREMHLIFAYSGMSLIWMSDPRFFGAVPQHAARR